ncbi:hypothetical protein ACQCU1_01825 [Sutcliffiella horikoshii]|uniref:hypothetical protein n=1 Tax=Sutcliffiella horikoshii TaxID=79883 RepID=UPI003CF2795E
MKTENHKTYNKHVEQLEDKPKHRIGKTIIRTYLEGACKINHANLLGGSRFKNKLSFVPDFILEFPSGQAWAIDYVTGLKEDKKYANSIKRRLECYEKHQLKPIILFDSYWLAYKEEFNYISLVEGELLCVKDTLQDKVWTEFLNKLEKPLRDIYSNKNSYSTHVQSMIYINPSERELDVVRFVQDPLNPLKTRTVCSPLKIPFEKAFVIDHLNDNFTYYIDNEEEIRATLKDQLIEQYEEQLKAQEERKRKADARRKQQSPTPTPKQMNRDLRFNQEIQKTGHPHWYKQMVEFMTRNDNPQIEVAVSNASEVDQLDNHVTSLIPKWKQEEVLNHYVNGEAYFSGESRKWKLIVLKSYRQVINGRMSIQKLLEEIKNQDIKTSQPDLTMHHPINYYIEYLGRKLKKELG